ncbi:Kelch repeat-containing protein [Spirosoma pollinicola]|nr:hypothetical protein [Spirosoma pollinicola]
MDKRCLFLPSLYWVLSCVVSLTSVGCSSPDLTVIITADPLTPPQASLVSVQATSATEAELILKITQGLAANAYQLTARRAGGQSLPLLAGDAQSVGNFSLIPLRLSGLTPKETYTFDMRFRFNNQDSIQAIRRYNHRFAGPIWQRLAHAPLDGGDYTAYPVADEFSNLTLGRYAGLNQMQAWQFSSLFNKWNLVNVPLLKMQPRRGIIQFNLFYFGDLHYFYGLGYAINEQASDKYFYYHDMRAKIGTYEGPVIPAYEGENGEVAFFITRDSLTSTDDAYFLTQNGSPAMRSIDANFPQVSRASLPESPGTLATFTVNNIGYVVNQYPNQPIHLWAYNSKTDSWQRRADFPGPMRSRGAGFSLSGKGYFGLGARETSNQGLRDLWQYDPTSDRWQYVTDYPGQGNRYLAVATLKEKVYLGWGYESQETASGVVRQVPCTDWWSFQPR